MLLTRKRAEDTKLLIERLQMHTHTLSSVHKSEKNNNFAKNISNQVDFLNFKKKKKTQIMQYMSAYMSHIVSRLINIDVLIILIISKLVSNKKKPILILNSTRFVFDVVVVVPLFFLVCLFA